MQPIIQQGNYYWQSSTLQESQYGGGGGGAVPETTNVQGAQEDRGILAQIVPAIPPAWPL